jgi:Spy/CpxP family protein refolding chaperone
MKPTKLLAAATLAIALGAAGAIYAEEPGEPASPPPPAPHEGGMGWHHHNELMELLPDDKQKLLKDAFEQVHKDGKAQFEKAHKLHEELEALLKAPKFDEEAFIKKSDEIGDLHMKMWQSHQKAIASVAAKFTPEERRVLLVMGHMMMQGGGMGGGHMGGGHHMGGWPHGGGMGEGPGLGGMPPHPPEHEEGQ